MTYRIWCHDSRLRHILTMCVAILSNPEACRTQNRVRVHVPLADYHLVHDLADDHKNRSFARNFRDDGHACPMGGDRRLGVENKRLRTGPKTGMTFWQR